MMTLLIIAYLGGALTILSPCILPILPFVFARADQPFLSSTLPMLIGMALTFALVATLAAVGGSWAVHANDYGRLAALALVAVFGASLISPPLASLISRPAVAAGNSLMNASRTAAGPLASLLLGIATGLLWAPCAGPILGLVLTGAALKGASLETTTLLFGYALGTVTSLGLALATGGRIFAGMKRSLGLSERARKVVGAAVIGGVAAVALGADTGLLARLSYTNTSSFEQAVLDRLQTKPKSEVLAVASADAAQPFRSGLPVEASAPSLDGAVTWLNSAPLDEAALRGKVVLVDFWTYSCINCIRTTPYVRAWAERYKDQGLVVIGVHSPEFAFEKKVANVEKAIADLGISYPVAIDNDYKIWRAFDNSYWPAHYLIDATGNIRYHNFGEGNYAETEHAIQDLLREAGSKKTASAPVTPGANGVEASRDLANIRSGETYLGYQRATNFASPEAVAPDAAGTYSVENPSLNSRGLSGTWTIGAEWATLAKPGGAIAYRFSARDLNLVLGPGADGKPVRFEVTVDGPPGIDHGAATTLPAMAPLRQQGSTSSSAKPVMLNPAPSKSAFSMPARKPMP